jgi:gluconate 5-dehydrogenase
LFLEYSTVEGLLPLLSPEPTIMGVLDRFRLDGKRLFITGGSRGLGREMALAIAEAGADIILTGRDTKSLDTAAEEIRQLGRRADTLQADMSDMDACESACQHALQHFGPIDILINNVGGRRENIPTQDMPLIKWRKLMDLNLTSTFLCTKLMGGAMIDRGQGGRIINVASTNAFVVGQQIAQRLWTGRRKVLPPTPSAPVCS